MISIDRLPISRADSSVDCPIQHRRVPSSECAACQHGIRIDDVTPPRFVVCDARYVLSWLGLDPD